METQHPLKIERKLRGWSQSRIAEALGITTRTVSRWEQGLAVPYPYYREQLCILYDKTAEELGLLSDTKQSDVVVEEAIPPAVPPTGVPEPVVPAVPVPHGSFLADPAIPEALGSTDS